MSPHEPRQILRSSPAAAALGAAALAGFVIAASADAAAWVELAPRLRALALIALLTAWVALIGFAAMGRFAGPSRNPGLPLSLALGWGILSLLVTALGAIGSLLRVNLFASWTPWILMAIGAILARRAFAPFGRALRQALLSRVQAPAPWAAWVLHVLLGALVARLCLSALTPSFLYDVLEYHLPDARHLIAAGWLASIPGNAYSLMPQAIEVLYGFGMLLEGNPLGFAPKLINLALALSTVPILNATARELGVGRTLRSLAALLLLAHPIVFVLTADAYVDMGTALFMASALLALCRMPNPADRTSLATLGIFLGLALGTKLTALGLVILPFGLVLLPRLIAGDPKNAVRNLAILSGAALAIYSPWLLRSFLIDHSPFPPLTRPWFAPPHDADTLALREFMAAMHQPEGPFHAAYWAGLWNRMHAVGTLPMLGLIFALFAFRHRRHRQVAWIALLGYLFWGMRGDAADRFLAPLLPATALLTVLMLQSLRTMLPRYGRWIAVPVVLWALLPAAIQTAHAAEAGWLRAAVGGEGRTSFLIRQMGVAARLFAAIDSATANTLHPRVLFIYEARTGAIEAPSLANTVFDPNPLWQFLLRSESGDPEEAIAWLRENGFTHVAVNEIELARLVLMYPALEARADAAWAEIAAQPAPGGFHPGMIALRHYYPPFHGYDGSDTEPAWARLDSLFERLRPERVWQENLQGAEIWVARIP